jgi:hypothetical protein
MNSYSAIENAVRRLRGSRLDQSPFIVTYFTVTPETLPVGAWSRENGVFVIGTPRLKIASFREQIEKSASRQLSKPGTPERTTAVCPADKCARLN